MVSSGDSTKFAEATAVKASSSHVYEAYFPDDWCIGSGMLCSLSICIEGASKSLGHWYTRASQPFNYLGILKILKI